MKYTIELKQAYLDNILAGKNKSIILFNAQDYQTGDTIVLIDYSGIGSKTYQFTITHIGQSLGLLPGYVSLSLEEIT